jgi:hypothetical protein
MRCPSCDTVNAPQARFCSHCGGKLLPATGRPEIEVVEEVESRRPQAVHGENPEDTHEPGTMARIIPYRNGKALASYYLGMLCLLVIAALIVVTAVAVVKQEPSMLAFYGPIAPAAVVLGPLALLLGILGLRSAILNPTARGRGHAIFGILFGLLATVLGPATLLYFLRDLEKNMRLLKEFWKIVEGR